MLPSQKKILDVLQQGPASAEKLARLTKLSPDGIRGRISEARKQGYDIRKIDGKYQLIISDRKKHAEEMLQYMQKYHLSGQKIPIDALQINLKISKEELTDALVEIYRLNRLVQISNKIVVIYL